MSTDAQSGMEAGVVSPHHPEEPYVSIGEFDARDAELWLYRDRTIAILKQYFRFSIEVGRLPSILGREFFRAKICSYHTTSFEDAVIFVHDVESALDRLSFFQQQVIATVIFEEYTQDEAADVLRCARRTVMREFPAAIDCVSEMFLEGGLLNQLPPLPVEKVCQEVEGSDFLLSDCKQAE